MFVNEDDFTRSQDISHGRWVAVLSDGTEYVEDEGRETVSAWIRLKHYLARKALSVVGLKLRFRAREVEPVPRNAKAYFFRKSFISDVMGGDTQFYYLVGYVDQNEVLRVNKYWMPYLEYVSEEVRELDVNDESYLGSGE